MRMRIPPVSVLAWAALFGLLLPACKTGQTSRRPRAQLVVFAASSLTEAFDDLAHQYESTQGDVHVQVIFAGSQALSLQIEQGALADVFASANEEHMQRLVRAGLALGSRTFATNELVVIVPASNPAKIVSFRQLDQATRLVVGSLNVPVGAYTEQLLERAAATWSPDFVTEVRRHIVSQESNVRLVRAKVELGEADAAIVYRTDAQASRRVHALPIPAAVNVAVGYVIAPLAPSSHGEHAARFVEYVLSKAGKQTLRAHGFAPERR
jgi:molybdate transport system substrate-binding protein